MLFTKQFGIPRASTAAYRQMRTGKGMEALLPGNPLSRRRKKISDAALCRKTENKPDVFIPPAVTSGHSWTAAGQT